MALGLEWTGKYKLRKYKFNYRYYHYSCNRHSSDCELSPKKIQGFNGIRDHNVGGRAAVLNLLSYEDPYIGRRSIFWVYCSSVSLFLVNAMESSEEELDNVSILWRVFSSKLLKTQIKKKDASKDRAANIFFSSIKRALLSHYFGRTQLRTHGVSMNSHSITFVWTSCPATKHCPWFVQVMENLENHGI